MSKKNNKSIKIIIIFVLSILIIPTLLVADPPVFKDDFICYDTTINSDWTQIYPKVTLLSNNNLLQINLFDTLVSPWDTYYTKGFSILNLDGSLDKPTLFYTPFSHNDTTVFSTAYCKPYTNVNGVTVVLSKGRSLNQQYIFLFDSLGQPMQDPVCVNCENPDIDNHFNWEPYGDINNNDRVGVVWFTSSVLNSPPGYRDSVYVRIYDYDIDSVYSQINIYDLSLPVIDEPEYVPSLGHRTKNQPKMGIADNGSFAVAWGAHGDDYTRILYVVYNADLTPRTEVQLADCLGSWADTANCTGVNSKAIDLAMEPDGDFYIVWHGYQYTPYADVRNHIWMRGFNADGTGKYDPVRCNDGDSLWHLIGADIYPQIACDDLGNVLVSWNDSRDYPGDYYGKGRNVYVQKIDPSGNLVGYNTRTNNYDGANNSNFHSLSLNNSGQALISWDYPSDTLPRVVAQLMPYDDIGTFVPGDINYDRSADIADLVDVVNYMFGGAINSFWPRSLTDFDASGATDIADLVYMVSYMFVGGPEPVTPDEGIRPNPGKFDLGG